MSDGVGRQASPSAASHHGRVPSASARVSRARPFYSEHAWAYDLLITDPVEPWVDVIERELSARGVTGASILDAGCGTGRQAAALIQRGHRVSLLDASADLLSIARRRCPASPVWRADLTTLRTPERFAAVTCRGVLNDLLSDADRQAALDALVACLHPGGVLICDVREVSTSSVRADGTARVTTVDLDASHGHAQATEDVGRTGPGSSPGGPAPAGTLVFTSTTTWRDGLLHVDEQHELTTSRGCVRSTYGFAMRPWTPRELTVGLRRAGVRTVDVRPGVGRRTPDRLLVVAER